MANDGERRRAMISFDDALRFAVSEVDQRCREVLDRYATQLAGKRDPDAKAKVKAYQAQLAEWREQTVAMIERELGDFCRAHKVVH